MGGGLGDLGTPWPGRCHHHEDVTVMEMPLRWGHWLMGDGFGDMMTMEMPPPWGRWPMGGGLGDTMEMPP